MTAVPQLTAAGLGEAEIEPEAVHTWFSLSYSSYLTIPRVVLEAMPDEWQTRFVAMMREMEEVFECTPTHEVRLRVAQASGELT